MKFDELFEKRDLVASKLKDCIRDKGYTKVSFAAKADISRPTLDKLLNGNIDNRKIEYKECLNIINKLRFNEESSLFAVERDKGLESIIGNIYQSFARRRHL